MTGKRATYFLTGIFIVLSFSLKLILILKYGNKLTLSSDDLNYIKSGIVLMEKGILTYNGFNEPTVFIMPVYPVFLAAVFKIFGAGLLGMQTVRIIQAVFSSITIILVFMTANKLFNQRVALLSSFLTAFYIPNITTVGYMLTETLFTMLFMVLIYYTLRFIDQPYNWKFAVLGVIIAITTLCRPTVALYPFLMALYYYLYKKPKVQEIIKLSFIVIASFVIVMSPWWVRNYKEYGEFIPLAASSGNPMLQGTYVDYLQKPENIVYYKLGRNALETNKAEVEAAKQRIGIEFKKDFWGYLNWYTVKKTILFWCGAFYWQEVFGIKKYFTLAFHYVLLLGIPGILVALFKYPARFILPVSLVAYFNFVHCVYMAFDRYAYPLMPLISIFSSFFILTLFNNFRSCFMQIKNT